MLAFPRLRRCLLSYALPLLLAAPAESLPDFHNPRSAAVLVTPKLALPHGFRPRDLVVPDVPFTFSGFDEKRQVRRAVVRPAAPPLRRRPR